MSAIKDEDSGLKKTTFAMEAETLREVWHRNALNPILFGRPGADHPPLPDGEAMARRELFDEILGAELFTTKRKNATKALASAVSGGATTGVFGS